MTMDGCQVRLDGPGVGENGQCHLFEEWRGWIGAGWAFGGARVVGKGCRHLFGRWMGVDGSQMGAGPCILKTVSIYIKKVLILSAGGGCTTPHRCPSLHLHL